MKTLFPLSLALCLLLAACSSPAAEAASADCPVTQPPDPAFRAPKPYPSDAPYPDHFWYGSADLWTLLPQDGVWQGLPFSQGSYGQKTFWWSQEFDYRQESNPEFSLFAERLDGQAPAVETLEVTHAFNNEIVQAILVGVNIPSAGCWRFTGSYAGHQLSFVVLVKP